MPRKRFPDPLIATVNSIIRAAAFRLREEKKRSGDDAGIQNFEIVDRIKNEVHALFDRHYLALTEHYLSTQVSSVLEGKSSERRVSTQQLIPGLDLAEWLAVPPDEDMGGSDRWKVPRDCSPNELQRIEERRDERIRKEQAEVEKIRIVRMTAQSRGCGPDDPISTVFDDDPLPLGPADAASVRF